MTDRGQRRCVHRSINSYPYNAGVRGQANLQASCKNSLDFVQRLSLVNTFNVHNGCVNTVNWNASGTYFVSGSDDNCLVITEAKSGLVVVKTKTQHKRHIFSARFMPHSNDQAIVSCSGEGIVLHTELLAPYGPGKRNAEEALVGQHGRNTNFFDCHAFGSTYDVLPLPDSPCVFLSCGEDGTVRCIDLRISSRCAESVCDKHVYITAPCAVTAMDVAPINHYKVAIGCSDSIVRLYDRRMLSHGADLEGDTWPVKAYPIPMKYTRRHYRPTSVKYSPDETELLVSYSMEQLYLFDLRHPGYKDADLLKSGCYTPKLRRDDEMQMPRLRFRGDWSDTGPNSMVNSERNPNRFNLGQARPPLEPGVLSRLSNEIFRMLNSQQTRQSRTPNLITSGIFGIASGSGGANGITDTNGTSSIGAVREIPYTGRFSNISTSGTGTSIVSGSPLNNGASSSGGQIRRSHLTWQNIVPRVLNTRNEAATTNHNNSSAASNASSTTNPISRVRIDGNPTTAADNDKAPAEGALTTTESAGSKEETALESSTENGQMYPLSEFNYVKMSFCGHRNSRTMVKGASFWGDDFIMSGSDCGHIFVWNRHTGKVVKTLLADHRVVNRVQPHPTLPYLLSSGIDYNIKLWAPIAPFPDFDESETAGLIKSNEIMLVETRDTITVPAQIMTRILASLHQYRRLMHTSNESLAPANIRSRRNRTQREDAVMDMDEAAAAAAPEENSADDDAADDSIDNDNANNDNNADEGSDSNKGGNGDSDGSNGSNGGGGGGGGGGGEGGCGGCGSGCSIAT